MTTHDVLRRAWTHIRTRTLAGATPEEIWRTAFTPSVWQAMQTVDTLVVTGDVLALQTACQAWNNAYKAALRALRERAAA